VKILHLAPDEKFIPFFDSVFSTLPGVANRYLIEANKQEPFKHVNGLDVWRVVGRDYFSSEELMEDLRWADSLIVHYLGINGARMILKAPAGVAIVWSGWGGDYYKFLPGRERALLGEETLQLIKKLRMPKQSLKDKFLSIARSIKHWLLEKVVVTPALSHVNFFSAPIKNDYVQLRNALGKKFPAEYIQLNYGSVEQTFLVGEEHIHGNNILVGNSAAITNNHLEIFTMLAVQDLGARKMIIPLSYGPTEYRDAVIERGRSIFGDHILPIRDYMPLADYNNLISECSVVIMNHRRQQALGNIGAMLYRGAKVFLEPNSPVYVFLKAHGAHVFSNSILSNRNDEVFAPLDNMQISTNRKILDSIWGHDAVLNNANVFIKRVKRYKRQHT
jgi:dTDP-N-acetylfucosamine:lipid II N-acetylfucosaminyltransferase